ncbi:hypothetical protein [Candidatus Enterovibrio altilux]|uniref:hypothetical protein n=1 Tax=Candidatus Enterovibrio altilux TaxID=1927128 RepID=UPI0012380FFB|nr:hypothetical protein [Candidatus Enterovibrio luxaltus]
MSCPHCSCVSKRVKMINVTFKDKIPGIIQYLAVGSTGFTVYGEGEWPAKNMALMVNGESDASYI